MNQGKLRLTVGSEALRYLLGDYYHERGCRTMMSTMVKGGESLIRKGYGLRWTVGSEALESLGGDWDVYCCERR